MTKKSTPDICVAIPTYMREQVLLDTINDVLSQSHKNLELVVVDQSPSHNESTAIALTKISDPRFRYFKAAPPSLPAARNFTLKVARAPIVLFLDDDVQLDPDIVKYHLAAFKKDPSISAVGGRVLQKGFPIKKDVLRFDEHAISHGVFTATKPAYTNAFPGGNHSLKVTDALKVGGFDTRYYWNAFREESDMSLKMVRNGMKIYYEPKAMLLHLAAPSGGTRTKTYTHIYDTPYFYRNELFFTVGAVKPGLIIKALRKKYQEYCIVPSRRQGLQRRIYFVLGLIVALWRRVFGRQIITKEVL